MLETTTSLRGFREYSKTIFAIALPVMLQSIVEYVFMTTDLAFIGQYRSDGLSAVNNVFQPLVVVFSFLFAISQGVTIVVSQRIGAKRPLTARRFAETAFFFNVLLSLGFLVFWLLLGGAVLGLMGARGEVFSLGSAFLRVFSLQFLTFGFGITAGALFQAFGKTMPLMIVSFAKCVLNIALDWLLIFGNLGFPELGIVGSATAGAVSWMAGDIVLFFLALKSGVIKVRVKGILRPSVRLYKRILRLGIPVGLEYMLWTLGQMLLVLMINRVDSVSSGYFGVYNMIINLSGNLYNGIGIAGLVLVGRATGARNPRQALKAANYAVFYSQSISVLVMAVLFAAPSPVLSLFVKSSAAVASLVPSMTIFALAMVPKALNVIAGNSIRGTGNTIWMMMTQVLGTGLIVAAAAVFVFAFGYGLLGLLFAVLLDEAVRAVINVTKFYRSQWRAVREAERGRT